MEIVVLEMMWNIEQHRIFSAYDSVDFGVHWWPRVV